jgi:hypothetical protein
MPAPAIALVHTFRSEFTASSNADRPAHTPRPNPAAPPETVQSTIALFCACATGAAVSNAIATETSAATIADRRRRTPLLVPDTAALMA